MTPVEFRKQKAARLQEARGVYDAIKAESREPTPEEAARVDALIGEADAFEAKAVGAEQWAVVDRRLAEMGQSSGRRTDPLPHEDPTNTRNGRHQYSMLKAIREACHGPTGHALTGVEKEVHQELAKSYAILGKKPRGIMVPNTLRVDAYAAARWAEAAGVRRPGLERYALDTTAGAGSIPTILEETMIDILRARMVMVAMGARVMENMQGLFAIPRQSVASSFYWVTQGNSVTASNQQIDQVPFQPHTGGVQTAYTRQFVEQTNQSAEAFIRYDQAEVIARGYETAGLNGPGSGGAPLGLLQNPLVPTVSAGSNGGAPTWPLVVQLESTVAEANADMGALGYITDASMRGTLKTTAKIGSTFPIYIWDSLNSPGRPLNDYPVGVTNLLPGNLVHGSGTSLHALLYGNWNDAYFAFWSGMDVVVDPYTQAGSGSVVITTLQDGDFNVRHPESFAKMPDLISTQ